MFDFGYRVGFKGLLPAVNNLRRPIGQFIRLFGQHGLDFGGATGSDFAADFFTVLLFRPRVHQFLIAQTAFFQIGGHVHQRAVTPFKIGTDVGLRADRFAVGVNSEAVNQAFGVGKVVIDESRNNRQREKDGFGKVLRGSVFKPVMHANLVFADVQIFALHIDMRIFQIFDAARADCTRAVVGMGCSGKQEEQD